MTGFKFPILTSVLFPKATNKLIWWTAVTQKSDLTFDLATMEGEQTQ